MRPDEIKPGTLSVEDAYVLLTMDHDKARGEIAHLRRGIEAYRAMRSADHALRGNSHIDAVVQAQNAAKWAVIAWEQEDNKRDAT